MNPEPRLFPSRCYCLLICLSVSPTYLALSFSLEAAWRTGSCLRLSSLLSYQFSLQILTEFTHLLPSLRAAGGDANSGVQMAAPSSFSCGPAHSLPWPLSPLPCGVSMPIPSSSLLWALLRPFAGDTQVLPNLLSAELCLKVVKTPLKPEAGRGGREGFGGS